jgi:hypothetical protein
MTHLKVCLVQVWKVTFEKSIESLLLLLLLPLASVASCTNRLWLTDLPDRLTDLQDFRTPTACINAPWNQSDLTIGLYLKKKERKRYVWRLLTTRYKAAIRPWCSLGCNGVYFKYNNHFFKDKMNLFFENFNKNIQLIIMLVIIIIIMVHSHLMLVVITWKSRWHPTCQPNV